VDPADLLVASVVAARRVEGWAGWQQLSGIAALLARWSPGSGDAVAGVGADPRGLDAADLARACVVTEVALAAGISEYAAGRRVDAAVALIVQDRLPLTRAVTAQGLLDRARVELVVARTRDLSRRDARAVEARVGADALVSLGYVRLRDALDRAVLALDECASLSWPRLELFRRSDVAPLSTV
jgi:hypothetical protein